jgi:thiol-disulfide isomerase/thioredoxin
MLAAAALLLPAYRLHAAGAAAAATPPPSVPAAPLSPAAAELKDLVARITTSLQAGQRTEASQADHLKEFDALLAKHKGETNNDDVAEIAFMKATLYLQIFQQPDKGAEMLKQVQRDFPNTASAKRVDAVLASIKQGEEAKKIQDLLSTGAAFPDFNVKDLDGKPLSIAGYKGKVVMLDFWATWCGPCVGEVPNVAAVYAKYHDKGFEIIGISLDREGDKDKLISFTKEHNMPWRQYFDGKFWSNELAVKYGIQSIPATFLLDGSGKIIGKNVRGPALEPAVQKALGVPVSASTVN